MRPHADDPVEPAWVDDKGFDTLTGWALTLAAAVSGFVFFYVFFWFPTR